jgi:fibro-slime domain-containing protein/RHS repeat-associated protein
MIRASSQRSSRAWTLALLRACGNAMSTSERAWQRWQRELSGPSIERLEERTLLAATLKGDVFGDVNADGIYGATDRGMPGLVVFVDVNRSGKREADEPFTTTDALGQFVLDSAPSNQELQVRADGEAGWAATLNGQGLIIPPLTEGGSVDGLVFGVRATQPLAMRTSGATFEGGSSRLWLTAQPGTVSRWGVDWGDGSGTQFITVPTDTYTTTFTKSYANDGSYDVRVRAEGVVTGLTSTTTQLTATVARSGSTWAVDAAFDRDGSVDGLNRLAASGFADGARALIHEPDGKLVVVGFAQSTTSSASADVQVARFLADGRLDTTFGGTGIVRADFQALRDEGVRAVRMNDGTFSIVALATQSTTGNPIGLGLLRLSATGTVLLRTSVAGTLPISDIDDLQTDASNPAKLLVAARAGTLADGEIVGIRISLSGLLDTSYGGTGVVRWRVNTSLALRLPAATTVEPTEVLGAMGRDGRLWATVRFKQTTGTTISYRVALLRYTSSGALDTTLGTGGVRLDAVQQEFRISSLLVLDSAQYPTGGLLLGGVLGTGSAGTVSSTARPEVRRLTNAGVQDNTFGSAGRAIINAGILSAKVAQLSRGPGNAIMVAGSGEVSRLVLEQDQPFIPSVGGIDTRLTTDPRTAPPIVSLFEVFAGVWAPPSEDEAGLLRPCPDTDVLVPFPSRVVGVFWGTRLSFDGIVDVSVANGTAVTVDVNDRAARLGGVVGTTEGFVFAGSATLSTTWGMDAILAQVVRTPARVVVSEVAPTITMTLTPDATVRTRYAASFTWSDPGNDTIDGILVDWGDGSTTVINQTNLTSPYTITKLYAWANNTYTVRAWLFDNERTGSVADANPTGRGYVVLPRSVTIDGTLTLNGIARDFQRWDAASPRPGHTDFKRFNGGGITPNLVQSTTNPAQSDLDPVDRVPVANTSNPVFTNQITSATSFSQWFRDTSFSRRETVPLRLERVGTTPVYRFTADMAIDGFATDRFFPLNGRGWQALPTNDPLYEPSQNATNSIGTQIGPQNFHFTMEVRTTFTYDSSQTYTFNFLGDDDLWLYINGKLAVDVGGVHAAEPGIITLTPALAASRFGMVSGGTYSIDLFFAERQITQSTFSFTTSIPIAGGVPLVEQSRFLTEPTAQQVYTFTPTAGGAPTIEVPITQPLTFDASSTGRMSDAFEIAVVDSATGLPVLPTIGAGRDAVFNVSESQGIADPWASNAKLATGVEKLANAVRIDVRSLPVGVPVKVIARLVNNDTDITTRVTLGANLVTRTQVVTPATPGGNTTPAPAPARPIDFDELRDVTGLFDLRYTRTEYNRKDGKVYAEFTASVRDDAAGAVRGPLLAVVDNVRLRRSGQSIVLPFDADGFTPDGKRYFNISTSAFSLDNQVLTRSESFAGGVPAIISFLSRGWPSGAVDDQFDYDLRLLGDLNDAPVWTSEPVRQAELNQAYIYQGVARDPDVEPLTYSVVGGPSGLSIGSTSGLVTWAVPVQGGHSVVLRATDPQGLFRDQEFVLTVLPSIPNRPPRFTTQPVVDAFSQQLYRYDADAFDADAGDILSYRLVSLTGLDAPYSSNPPAWTTDITFLSGTSTWRHNPTGFSISAVTGEVLWTPTVAMIDKRFRPVLEVSDNAGLPFRGTDQQTYTITVLQDPANNPPSFVTEPTTTHVVPGFPRNSSSNASAPITLNLGLNEVSTAQPVTITLDASQSVVPKIDIVFLWDSTGSFNGSTEAVRAAFGQLVTVLRSLTSLNNVDLGFGVSRYEDYGGTSGSNAGGGGGNQPFFVNHPIVSLGTASNPTPNQALRRLAIESALSSSRSGYGGGGDTPESLVEALYQAASGAGFDGNGDGDTTDNGTAADFDVQGWIGSSNGLPDGSSGDVPAFATYQPDTSDMTNNPMLPAEGTIGGMGFRTGALPIIISATDTGTRFKDEGNIIQGAGGQTYQLRDFAFLPPSSVYREASGLFNIGNFTDAPPGGLDPINGNLLWYQAGYQPLPASASFQDAVGALRNIGALTIGLVEANNYRRDTQLPDGTWENYFWYTGYEDPITNASIYSQYSAPRYMYEALSRATGAVNATTVSIPSGVAGDDIEPNEPFVFAFQNDSSPSSAIANAQRIARAIEAAAISAFVDVEVRSTNPNAIVSIAPPVAQGVRPGEQANFMVTFRGDGNAQDFDLVFYRAGTNIEYGRIPVQIATQYIYNSRAVDPDPADVLQYGLVDSNATYNATTNTITDPDTGFSINRGTGRVEWTARSAGVFNFTIDVTDGRGGRDTQPVTINVSTIGSSPTNRAPVITTTAPTEAIAGRPLSYDVDATDQDGDRLDYYIANLPPDITMSIDRESGVLTWNVPELPAGLNSRLVEGQVKVYDRRGGIATQPLSITIRRPVSNTNNIPVFTTSPVRAVAEETEYVYRFNATDQDRDPLDYTLVAAPAGMTMDEATKRLVWTPDRAQIGRHNVLLRVEDGRGGFNEQAFQVNVFSTNLPPEITSIPQGPLAIGQQWTYNLEATDPNGDLLTWELVQGPTSPPAVIERRSTDAASPLYNQYRLRWTPPATTGTNNFVLRVRDGRGGEDFQGFGIVVSQFAAPVFQSEPPAALLNVPWTYRLRVTDPDTSAALLTYSAVELPPGFSLVAIPAIENPTPEERFKIVGTFVRQVEHTMVIRVQDPQGAWATQTITIRPGTTGGVNLAPEISSTPGGPAQVGRTWEYQVVARDPDPVPGEPLRYDFLTPPPTGMTIDAASGLVRWNAPIRGFHEVVVRVRDRAGAGAATTTQTFTLPVIDNAPPIIRSAPPTLGTVGTAYQYTVDAIDPPNAPSSLTYAIVDPAPPGLAFVGTTNVLRWATPVAGTYDVAIRVTDVDGASSIQQWRLQVRSATNSGPPTITSTPRGVVAAGTQLAHQFLAIDPDFDPVSFTIGSTPGGVFPDNPAFPTGMTLTSAGLLAWIPTVAQINAPGARYAFRVTANDGRSGTSFRDFTVRVVATLENQAPEITSQPPQFAQRNALMTYQLTAIDPENDRLAWVLESGPTGASLNPDTGLLGWTPTQVGNAEFSVRVFDSLGGYARQTLTVQVRTGNAPPLIVSSPGTMAARDQDYEYIVRVQDPDSDTLTFTLSFPQNTGVAGYPSNLTPASVGMQLLPVTGDPYARRLVWSRTAIASFNTSVPIADPLRVRILVTDELGAGSAQVYDLDIVTSANQFEAPRFTPAPAGSAVVDQQYVYRFQANSPSNSALRVLTSLTQSPSNVGTVTLVRVTPTGGETQNTFELRFTPPSGVANTDLTFEIRAELENIPTALVAFQRFVVRPRQNQAPTITPIANQSIERGRLLRIDVAASDPDAGDQLRYTLINVSPANPGLTINETTGTILWDTSSTTNGQTQDFQVRVTDLAGAVVLSSASATPNQATRITITQDVVAPVVTVLPSLEPIGPGAPIIFYVQAQDLGGIATLRLEVREETGVVGGPTRLIADLPVVGGQANWVTPATLPNNLRWIARGIAVDNSGNQGSADRPVNAQDPTNVNAPTIAILSPFQDEVVRDRVDLRVFLQDAQAFTYWFDLSSDGGQTWRRMNLLSGSTTGSSTLFATNDHRVDGVIAQVDATFLRNGGYVVRVSASDGSNLSNLERDISVRGDLKLGNFTLNFTDAAINVPGMPLQVRRSYDTLNVDQRGDFGWGWRLDLQSVDLEVNEQTLLPDPLGGNWPAFEIGTRISVRLPDGSTAGYTFQPRYLRTQGWLITYDIYEPAFVPDPGVTARLETIDKPEIYYGLTEGGGDFAYWQLWEGGGGGFSPYNPAEIGTEQGYYLTLDDGTRFEIDAGTGDMRRLRDEQGNSLEVNDDGFTSFNPTNQVIGRIRIQRDQGRVIRIDLRPAEDANPRYLSYGYDTQGRLAWFENENRERITYGYGEQHVGSAVTPPERYLTTIRDTRGVETARMLFSADGRLSAIRDAENNNAAINFSFSVPALPGLTATRVLDALNRVSLLVRNSEGDVVRRIEPVVWTGSEATSTFSITVFDFDAQRYQIGVSKPLQRVGMDAALAADLIPGDSGSGSALLRTTLALWENRSAYDPTTRRLLQQTDGSGRTSVFEYNADGDLSRSVDPSGVAMRLEYDPATRRLLRTIEELPGGLTRQNVSEYNTNGNLILQKRIDEFGVETILSRAEYNSRGLIVWSQSADWKNASGVDTPGLISYSIYDNEGRRTIGYTIWDDGAPSRTIVERTWFDVAGRVIRTGRYALSGAIQLKDQPALIADITINGERPLFTEETEYFSNGMVKLTRDRYGALTETWYNRRGQATKIISSEKNAAGATVQMVQLTAYDTNGRVVASSGRFDPTSTDEVRGTHTVYDALGRASTVTQLRNVRGLFTEANADPLTQIVNVTFNEGYASGLVMTRSQTLYDPQGRVSESIQNFGTPAALRTTLTYDAAGRKESETTYEDLDANGSPEQYTSQFIYDGGGRLVRTIDPLGRSVRSVHDRDGRVIETRMDGQLNDSTDDIVTQTDYDALGRKIRERDGRNNQTTSIYDTAGRLLKTLLPGVSGGVPAYSYTYDIRGNRLTIRDPNGHDASGNALADNRVTRFTYDWLGRQISRTLPLGSISTTANDYTESMVYNDTRIEDIPVANRASSVGAGQLERTTDLDGNKSVWFYDNTAFGRGRLVRQEYRARTTLDTDPADEVVTFRYDQFGRTVEVVQAIRNGPTRTTRNTFDVEGRITRTTLEDSTQTAPFNATQAINYQFDDLGRKVRTWTGAVNAPAAPVASDGRTTDTRYVYDERGRVRQVQLRERFDTPIAGVNGEVTAYTYNAGGELVRQDQSNGSRAEWLYDAFGRVDVITQFSAGATQLVRFDYTYDKSHNRTEALEFWAGASTPSVEIDYDYDAISRLTRETGQRTTLDNALRYRIEFDFDRASNRTFRRYDATFDGVFERVTQYALDANDRVLSETVRTQSNTLVETITYTWTDGVLGSGQGTKQATKTTRNAGSVVTESNNYFYDPRGRMQRADVDGNGAAAGGDSITRYQYDQTGARIEQERTDTQVTRIRYLFDQMNPTGYAQAVEEWRSVAGSLLAVWRTVTLGLDVIASARTDQFAGATTVFAYDNGPTSGSVRAITAAGGTIVASNGTQRFFYDANGQLIAVAGGATAANALTDLLYRGEAFDSSTKLQYLRARFYDASQGRFTSLDPFQGDMQSPLSLHKYMYAHANPVAYDDPTGLFFSAVGSLLTSGIQGMLRGLQFPAVITARSYAIAFAKTAALSGIAFYYQTVYIPPLATALDRFASELSNFSPAGATTVRQLANSFRINYAISALVTTQSPWLALLPTWSLGITALRVGWMLYGVTGAYWTMTRGMTFTTPTITSTVTATPNITRIIGNLLTFQIDPAGDINNATSTLFNLRTGNLSGAATSFQQLWSNAGDYLSSGSASLRAVSPSGGVNLSINVSARWP